MPERLPLPRLAAGAILLLLPPLMGGRALAQDCPGADGRAGAVVARLVSVEGRVLIDGRPPAGVLPRIAICPGSTLEVGRDSRVAVYLNEARTPLQLEESTRVRFQPPAEPGSGLVEMARGALYFLSEVRRTLTVRTPYVTAGVEGTEVYLRVDEPEAAAELIVLEGRVAVAPAPRNPTLEPLTATTGERVEVARGGAVARTSLPSDGTPFGALRRVTVGQLAWTLFYPDVLAGTEAQGLPRITEAARLLAAGQVAEAEAVLANVPEGGREAGLRDALRATIAFARKDAGEAQRLADRAIALAPDAASPRLAASYARQLALDLDGAVAAVEAAVAAAPQAPLPQARVAELRLMRGEIRAARRAAAQARALGGGPLAEIVLGYAELAALRGRAAEDAFLRALAQESRNPLALLGLGLAEIKQGRLEDGTQQIESAVVHDPSSSLLRSYLGKAYFEDRRDASAGTQFAIAKDLDPSDPTPWFYDAIRKQLDNRPVEALRDLQRSIALNDNRAPFRSRLLLDQDAATRGVSLGRIYDDLGFRQLGMNEAARALTGDPTSAAAHRFLSDLYRGQSRLEIGRVSELLQSQLLSPPSLDPVQPSLAYADLGTVQRSGPAAVAFNEFTPVFLGDGIRLTATGQGGNLGTLGGEAAIAGLFGRTSISLAQYYYDTDGFRPNNELKNTIFDVFANSLVTSDLGLQLEFRKRDRRSGDLRQAFDPDVFSGLDRDIDEEIFRFGSRYELSAGQYAIASVIHANRREEVSDSGSVFFSNPLFGEIEGLSTTDLSRDSRAHQGEAQYLGNFRGGRVILGGGIYDIDQNDFNAQTIESVLGSERQVEAEDRQTSAQNVYGYTTTSIQHGLDLTAGVTYEAVDLGQRQVSGLGPKLGVFWQAAERLALRAAATRSIKRSLVTNQTIEPTLVGGVPQFADEENGTQVDQIAFGTEIGLLPNLTLAGVWMHRELTPAPRESDGNRGNPDEDIAESYLYWTAGKRLAAAAGMRLERFTQSRKDAREDPSSVHTVFLPFELRYFVPSGLFVTGKATHVHHEVELAGEDGTDSLDSAGWLLDATIGYRLPGRRAIAAAQVFNLLDRRLKYFDDSFRTPEFDNPRFYPQRTFLVTLTLSF